MIIRKSNTSLIRALRELVKEQRALITALEERIRIQERIYQARFLS